MKNAYKYILAETAREKIDKNTAVELITLLKQESAVTEDIAITRATSVPWWIMRTMLQFLPPMPDSALCSGDVVRLLQLSNKEQNLALAVETVAWFS